jgi:hypothetical protein
VHPRTGAIVVRTGVRYVDDGKVTARLNGRAKKVLARYDKAFEELAK